MYELVVRAGCIVGAVKTGQWIGIVRGEFVNKYRLKNFDFNNNEVFYELYKLSNKNNKINIEDLGFLIGPILNSGGRLGKSSYATELLTSNKYDVIKKRAAELFLLNQKRREITILGKVELN